MTTNLDSTFEALMLVNIVRMYKISTKELHDLVANGGKFFIEKWKGPACEDLKKQKEHKNLIPQSIVGFMHSKITRDTT